MTEMTKRRTYIKEFKIEAVELADKIDNSAQAERDLGIPHGFG
ncbi:transposase-like protein [Salinibacter ruber]|nr:transposase-like protein [Salinibacter ruber]